MEQELICRTCLSNTSKCLSIYSMPTYCGKTFTISKMIMACAPVEISEGDGLPPRICENCLRHLQISFLFRIRVLQANEKLKVYLRTKLVPNMQPVCEDFIKPLVIPSDDDLNQLFSWDQVLQPTENETDPLLVDPLKFIKQTKIKIETKQEMFPIEEVMLPSNTVDYETDELPFAMPTKTADYSTNKTNELPCAMPTMTADYSTNKTGVAMSTTAESDTLIPTTNMELDQSSQMTHISWTNNTLQHSNSNSQNTDCNTNMLQIQLSENDTNLMHNIIQTIQSGQINPNSRYIVVQSKQTNISNKDNSNQIESSQPQFKSLLIDQNTTPCSSKRNIQNTFNKSSIIQNSTVNKSTSSQNIVSFDNKGKKTFEDELKKFVMERQKCVNNAARFSFQVNSSNKYEAKHFIAKKKKLEPPSIDLTSDDDTTENPLLQKPGNDTYNLVRSQYNTNSSNASPFLNQNCQKKDNNIVRFNIEDQSSAIIIDD